MPRKFRLTCARTTYFDVEVAAESRAEAELLLEAALRSDPELCERNAIARSIDRVVEIAVEEEFAAALQDAAA